LFYVNYNNIFFSLLFFQVVVRHPVIHPIVIILLIVIAILTPILVLELDQDRDIILDPDLLLLLLLPVPLLHLPVLEVLPIDIVIILLIVVVNMLKNQEDLPPGLKIEKEIEDIPLLLLLHDLALLLEKLIEKRK
jgi:hypothetical protein